MHRSRSAVSTAHQPCQGALPEHQHHKTPCKRSSLYLLRSKDRTSERNQMFPSLRWQSLLICSSTVEGEKENKLLLLVSLFGHILDDKVTSWRKWGHLHSSSQRKAELKHCFSCLHPSRASKVFSPHTNPASYSPLPSSCFTPLMEQTTLESPKALQTWGLLIHIPHSWGEANQPHVTGPQDWHPLGWNHMGKSWDGKANSPEALASMRDNSARPCGMILLWNQKSGGVLRLQLFQTWTLAAGFSR